MKSTLFAGTTVEGLFLAPIHCFGERILFVNGELSPGLVGQLQKFLLSF